MTRTAAKLNDVAPRAIIVGAGLMGRYHARAAQAARTSIVAVVDRDDLVARTLAAQFRGATSGTDFGKVAGSIEAEVVHICTPADTHISIGELAAKAGLHALIEKPVAPDAERTKRLFKQFEEAKLIVCPAHQYAFQQSLRNTIGSLSRLGEIRHIAFDICSAGAVRSGMGLDELVDEILPHPLAMIQKMLPGADVASAEWSSVRSAPGEWLIAAPVNGVLVTMVLSMSGRPTRFMTKVTADHGTVELDNFHDFAVSWPGRVSTAQKIAAPFIRGGLGLFSATRNLFERTLRREFAYPGLATLVAEFYAAVRDPGKVAPPITPAEAIAVAVARDRIGQLARHG